MDQICGFIACKQGGYFSYIAHRIIVTWRLLKMDDGMNSNAKNSDGAGENDSTEIHSFEADVSKLLHLMVHSVYTEREIFLRELISNASDACDKLRYLAITQDGLLGDDTKFAISIVTDEASGHLTIVDNGLGMGRDELIENLGTIAKSGTQAFLDKIGDGEISERQIGQFGVGFYSAFMVADRIEVISRKAGEVDVWQWDSEGTGNFNITELDGGDDKAIARGTSIKLHLKEDAQEFLKAGMLQKIVRDYSDYVIFPIMLIDGDAEPRQINSGQAIWTRPKSEIKDNDYQEFYRHISGQFDDPSLRLHYRAEGRHEYSVLLFVPTMKPFDLYDPARKGAVKLYVRRVFITDDADLLPPYLRFMRGVIDSEDMPLNISREMLQNNQIVQSIRKAVTNRILSELKKCAAKDSEKYPGIWESFGSVLKEGLYEDPERRDDLFELARFRSSKSDELVTLAGYVEGMCENQTAIYYLVGDDIERLKSSPQLEGFRGRGVEVLLMHDPVDNFWVQSSVGFDGKPFMSITQGDVDLSAISPEDKSEINGEEPSVDIIRVVQSLKTLLEGAISDVQISKRLVESPACLVASAEGADLGLDKILNMRGEGSGILPVLEINGTHDLIAALASASSTASASAPGGGQRFEDLGWLLLDEARIVDGEKPVDPAKFAERLNRIVLGKYD